MNLSNLHLNLDSSDTYMTSFHMKYLFTEMSFLCHFLNTMFGESGIL
jgi:hypothetical protein